MNATTAQPLLDDCRQALLPLGLAVRYRQHQAQRGEGCGTWHLVEVRQGYEWRILGQGSTMLGAYRQSAERLDRFGLAAILMGVW